MVSPLTAAAHRTKTDCLGSVPDVRSLAEFVSEVSSYLRNAMTFWVGVAEMLLVRGFILTSFLEAKSLECKPDR